METGRPSPASGGGDTAGIAWEIGVPNALADVDIADAELVIERVCRQGSESTTEPDQNATRGQAPPAPAGLDPEELVVAGEHFVVTRRADSPGTYDFAWTSHPTSYGLSATGATDWKPSRDELVEEIHGFLAGIDPETGYLRD